jgi:hypothetical protein
MPLLGPPNVDRLKKRCDVEGLIQALGHKDGNVRRAAADALGEIGDAEAIPVLIQAMGDVAGVREAAVTALGKCGDAQVVEPLIQTLDDEHPWIRVAAVNALGVIGDMQAVEPLIQMLDDEPLRVRVAAISALGVIGDAQAVKPLVKALRDPEPDVCGAAATALVDGLGWRPDKRRVKRLIQDMSSGSTARCAVALLRAFGKLTDGTLQGACLEQAHLERMDLRGANLEQANLRKANLGWSNLANANLQMADLKGANLVGTVLTGANLKGANLEEAALEIEPGQAGGAGAWTNSSVMPTYNYGGAAEIIGMASSKAHFDDKTILPNGDNWSPRIAMKRFADPSRAYFWRSADPASPAYQQVQGEHPATKTPDINLDPH